MQCGYCFPNCDNFLRIIPPAFGPSYLESPSPRKAAPPTALRPTTLASVAPAISIGQILNRWVRLLALTRRGAFDRVSGQKRIVLREHTIAPVATLSTEEKGRLECGFLYQLCWQFWCSLVSPHAAVVRSVRASGPLLAGFTGLSSRPDASLPRGDKPNGEISRSFVAAGWKDFSDGRRTCADFAVMIPGK